jgi:hypothetical protein
MAEFTEKEGKLFIDGKEVLKGWESFSGWYWFATEKVQEQMSMLEPDKPPVKDTIWYGLVQGMEEEWGDFSQAELEELKGKVWEIPKTDLVGSGRRKLGDVV